MNVHNPGSLVLSTSSISATRSPTQVGNRYEVSPTVFRCRIHLCPFIQQISCDSCEAHRRRPMESSVIEEISLHNISASLHVLLDSLIISSLSCRNVARAVQDEGIKWESSLQICSMRKLLLKSYHQLLLTLIDASYYARACACGSIQQQQTTVTENE